MARDLSVREIRGQPHRSHGFLPAAGYHFLTPLYDFGSALFGAGPRMKERVLDAAGIADGDRVLDLGCGTGVLAVLIKRRYPGCVVTGIDIDPKILAIAERRAAKARVHVELVCAPAERTGLPDASFDVVVSTLAFHHLAFGSKQQAVGEVVRVLRPGGTFFIVDLQPWRRRPDDLTAEATSSPRLAFATNTVARLRAVLSETAMLVAEEKPPTAWVLTPWLFALRATKPGQEPAPRSYQ